jgi:hypothetical protein
MEEDEPELVTGRLRGFGSHRRFSDLKAGSTQHEITSDRDEFASPLAWPLHVDLCPIAKHPRERPRFALL